MKKIIYLFLLVIQSMFLLTKYKNYYTLEPLLVTILSKTFRFDFNHPDYILQY